MNVNKTLSACLLILISTSSYAHQFGEYISLSGSARVRGESKNNSNFTDLRGDRIDFMASRFRAAFKIRPMESSAKWHVLFQPQFTKTWGLADATAAAGGGATSGALYDAELSVHQAFISYDPCKNINLTLGRQELSYGDELVIGSVGWSNVGRSFDAAKIRYQSNKFWIDGFGSKILESNASTAGSPYTGDNQFFGAYASFELHKYLSEFDLYYLRKHNRAHALNAAQPYAQTETTLSTWGTRLKSEVGNIFDYRFELTLQDGHPGEASIDRNYNSRGEYQADLEVGARFMKDKYRIGFEYFIASKEYDQLFPTAHKWLGIADQFSRRNIEGFVVHLKGKPIKKFWVGLDYHNFRRKSTGYGVNTFTGGSPTPTAYYSGTAAGTSSNDNKIAQEWDLQMGYKLADGLNFSLGGARVIPGGYLKTIAGGVDGTGTKKLSDSTEFYYAQLMAKF